MPAELITSANCPVEDIKHDNESHYSTYQSTQRKTEQINHRTTLLQLMALMRYDKLKRLLVFDQITSDDNEIRHSFTHSISELRKGYSYISSLFYVLAYSLEEIYL
jgi:hypothetical protein